MTTITGKSKNTEIQKAFAKQLNDGYAFVAAIDETSNPQFLSVMFVQSADNGNKSPLNLALGWTSHIIKMWMNFAIENVNFEVGATANEIFSELAQDEVHLNLKEVESFEPRTWVNKDGSKGSSQPKLNPSTGELVTVGDLPVYRSTEMTYDLQPSISKVTVLDAIRFKTDRSVGTPLNLNGQPNQLVEDFSATNKY